MNDGVLLLWEMVDGGDVAGVWRCEVFVNKQLHIGRGVEIHMAFGVFYTVEPIIAWNLFFIAIDGVITLFAIKHCADLCAQKAILIIFLYADYCTAIDQSLSHNSQVG